jgi:hypothetical protein
MVHEQQPERSRADPVFDYAAGAAAGAVNVVTGYVSFIHFFSFLPSLSI